MYALYLDLPSSSCPFLPSTSHPLPPCPLSQLHLSHHWPSSTSHLRLLLHSPFSAAHTCACRWSSTRLTRPHRNGSSIRDREVQTGASRGAGSAGGGDMRASHVNTSNGLAVDGGGNGRGGVCESTDSSPGEVGLWSAGRGEVEQQGGGAAGSGGGGVVQVARAKACVPMWHGMDVRLTSSMRYSMPWCIGSLSHWFADSSLAASLGSFHIAVDKIEAIFSLF
ncbi:unnamed protein product [Closterium sp. NIES-53]